MKKIRFFGDLLAEKYGVRLHRIPFDLGLSCPNRRNGTGPCAYCAENGALARHLVSGMELAEQARAGKDYIRSRYGSDGPYQAYFQAFTNTFAPVSDLRRLYSDALATGDYKVLVIATRPDCLSPECLDYLTELRDRYELWIELGVQTSHDSTLRLIRRGHDFACTEDAVRRLHERSIHCAAHLILGLPGETPSDFNQTADRIAALPFEAVKMHNLLVLRGTPMAKMLRDGLVHPMNEYEYAAALTSFLRRLPDSMAVMRLSADAPRDEIIEPRWWMKKGQFREMFLAHYEQNRSPEAAPFEFACRTEDGSYTFYHPGYHQHFHSTAGAGTESYRKYLEPCRIRERLEQGENLTVLDVGFGMGFNVSALYRTWKETGKGSLRVVSLESDPAVVHAAAMLRGHPEPEMIRTLTRVPAFSDGPFRLELRYGDARKNLPDHLFFDAVFLDAFSPDANPELWTCDFLGALKMIMKPDGVLATYSSAYPVCGALLQNGFHVYMSEPFGRKRGGLLASPVPQDGLPPLPEKDFLIATRSTAGTPYADPDLSDSRETILRNHAARISELRKLGMPKWFRK